MTKKTRNTTASGSDWAQAGRARERRGVLTGAIFASVFFVAALSSTTTDINPVRSPSRPAYAQGFGGFAARFAEAASEGGKRGPRATDDVRAGGPGFPLARE